MTRKPGNARIELVCTLDQKQRLQAKAAKAHLSMKGYLLKRGLEDDRLRDTEDSAELAGLYRELVTLNERLRPLPYTALVIQAINLVQQVGREVVLHRLARRGERGE